MRLCTLKKLLLRGCSVLFCAVPCRSSKVELDLASRPDRCICLNTHRAVHVQQTSASNVNALYSKHCTAQSTSAHSMPSFGGSQNITFTTQEQRKESWWQHIPCFLTFLDWVASNPRSHEVSMLFLHRDLKAPYHTLDMHTPCIHLLAMHGDYGPWSVSSTWLTLTKFLTPVSHFSGTNWTCNAIKVGGYSHRHFVHQRNMFVCFSSFCSLAFVPSIPSITIPFHLTSPFFLSVLSSIHLSTQLITHFHQLQ